MEVSDGWEIEGLDAYPEMKVKGRFPTKKHVFVECPRHGKTVDIIFTRIGRPLCLSVLGKDMCDFCWAHNLVYKNCTPESFRLQLLEEARYWQNVKIKCIKNKSVKSCTGRS